MLPFYFFLGGVISNAQTTDTAPSETSFTVDFPINDHRVIPSFGNNRATIDSLTTPPAAPSSQPVPEPELEPEPEPVEIIESFPAEPVSTDCTKGWHISSSLPALGMAIANLSGHYDFACRWSAALTLCYAGWNYGTSTRKFRTFIFRPEARYWLRDGHSGFFVDGHLAMAAYNFAMPSWHYRIQDVGGDHPALGGGIGIGYRLPLGLSGRWAVEAQLGAGVYRLKYDRFENRPNGPLVDTRSRTWAGIDNFAISLVYNFNPAKK